MRYLGLLLFYFMIGNVHAQNLELIEQAKDAIINNDTLALQQVIDSGLDVNERDESGDTLFLYALAENSDVGTIQFLINSGADINAPSAKNGVTPLIMVTSEAENLQKQAIASKNGDIFSQQQAVERMKYALKMLRLLIKNNADVNQETPLGTPLMNAVRNAWNSDMVDILLQNGAKVNSQDFYGRTALFYAEAYANNKIVSQLLAAGADVDIKDFDGKSYMEAQKEDLLN